MAASRISSHASAATVCVPPQGCIATCKCRAAPLTRTSRNAHSPPDKTWLTTTASAEVTTAWWTHPSSAIPQVPRAHTPPPACKPLAARKTIYLANVGRPLARSTICTAICRKTVVQPTPLAFKQREPTKTTLLANAERVRVHL